MKRIFICLAVICFTALAPSLASANTFDQSVFAKIKNQPKLNKTKSFQGLLKTNQSLSRDVKAKKNYSSQRFFNSRKNVNEKLRANLKEINNLQNEGHKILKAGVVSEVSSLKKNREAEYRKKTDSYLKQYQNKLKTFTLKRNKSYLKSKKGYIKKLTKAYRPSEQRAIRLSFKKTTTKIRESFYNRVLKERERLLKNQKKALDSFKLNYLEDYNKIKAEALKTIEFLNERTTKQMKTLRSVKELLAKNLAKLGKKSPVLAKTDSPSPIKSSDTIAPFVPSNPSFNPPEWPNLNTPSKYLIPAGFLPKNIITFQNKMKKKFCQTGKYYNGLAALNKKAGIRLSSALKTLKERQDSFNDSLNIHRSLKEDYQDKKRKYEIEKKKRLSKPNDTDYERAKSRYKEAKTRLDIAVDSLVFAKAKLGQQKKQVASIKGVINKNKRKMSSLSKTQKTIKSKFEIQGRSCPGSVI